MRRLAALLAGALLSMVPFPAAAEAPRLVVLLVIDQLRPDRIGPELPGGFGRLTREGRVFRQAVLDHAMTETCPGHVSLATGTHPGRAGIPGNSFLDVENEHRVYCVFDADPAAAVLGGRQGRSPRNIRATALGDWMKQADPRSRVYGVSAKDRAAVALAGQRADAAYWLNRGGPLVGFTTSRYYREDLPAWVRRWNGLSPPLDGFLSQLPESWEHDAKVVQMAGRPDDFDGESERWSGTSNHPIRDRRAAAFAENLMASPYLDEVTLDFARTLVEEEALGQGPAPDLLGLSLSGTDWIGHLYGPFSHESLDALARLDRSLARFLGFLEERVGEGRVLVALSSDHGVLPLPEWLAVTGEETCPVPGGRVNLRRLAFGVLWDLHWRFAGPFTRPRNWMLLAGTQLAIKRSVAESHGVAVEEVVAATQARLEAHPAIARAWTGEELRRDQSEMARLYRHSVDPTRSGDLALQVAEGCLLWTQDTGTSHGSPHLYDRAVPMLFWGDPVRGGVEWERVATVDVAPTLAGLLGIPVPEGLDGRDLLPED